MSAASLPAGDARSPVRWAGGKAKLVTTLASYMPRGFGAYYEPMVGGGALFWHLANEGRLDGHHVFLSDACEPLIRTYHVIRWELPELLRLLREKPITSEHFYSLRDADTKAMTHAEAAAWFLYLNKTCFNGLFRVNRKGIFNTPWGRWEKYERTPLVADEMNLAACASLLRKLDVHLRTCDFDQVPPERGDFVYFDPPYFPKSKTANFTSYGKVKFDVAAQIRLRDFALALKARGVYVMLSNSDTQETRALYGSSGDFTLHETSAPRAINSKADKRGLADELIITTYAP